jgi:hypothetical protein
MHALAGAVLMPSTPVLHTGSTSCLTASGSSDQSKVEVPGTVHSFRVPHSYGQLGYTAYHHMVTALHHTGGLLQLWL